MYADKAITEGLDTEIYLDMSFCHYPLRQYTDMMNTLHSVIKDYDKIGKRNHKKDDNQLNKHAMHLVRLFMMGIDILEKALLALGKSNPNIMEWANSPIIYRKTDQWDEIWKVAQTYFSEKSALCHYYGTARSTYQGFLTGNQIRYKKYFYALRPLLCCRYIERYHKIPPMEFNTLLGLFDGSDADLSDKLFQSIQELLKRKVITEEKDLNPQMPEIIDFIKVECLKQKQISEALKDDRKHDFSELNQVFRRICSAQM